MQRERPDHLASGLLAPRTTSESGGQNIVYAQSRFLCNSYTGVVCGRAAWRLKSNHTTRCMRMCVQAIPENAAGLLHANSEIDNVKNRPSHQQPAAVPYPCV